MANGSVIVTTILKSLILIYMHVSKLIDKEVCKLYNIVIAMANNGELTTNWQLMALLV
jgi:hypothetical protein